MQTRGLLGVQVGLWGGRVCLALKLPPFPLPGPEKSQLVSGEATVAELDGLEPDTEYRVHVRAHVAGVDGTPASVVVRTGEWTLASWQPHLIGYPHPTVYSWLLQLPAPSLLSDFSPLTKCLPSATSWLLHTVHSGVLTSSLSEVD